MDAKCSSMSHDGKLYIYHGYVIDDSLMLEEHIVNGTVESGMNGNYFVIELSTKSVKVLVDYFSQHKIFYRHIGNLFEVSNRIYLFPFELNDIDNKRLLDRNREKPDRLTRETRTDTLFKNTKILPAYHLLTMDSELSIRRIHDPSAQIRQDLFDSDRLATDRNRVEDFVFECMEHHSSVLKKKYKNIVSSISEGIDSILQDCFFPEDKKITYDFFPSTVDLSYKNKFINSINTAKVERNQFILKNQGEVALELADDPETTHPDCLPTIWQIKKFYPDADLLLYGQLGDQIFMHDPFLLYMITLGELADNESTTNDEKYTYYCESVRRYSTSYSSRETISSEAYHHQDSRFSIGDKARFADNIKHLAGSWRDEVVKKIAPLSSTYSRDLIHSCDIAVSSLYADSRFFGVIHRADRGTIMDNMTDVTTQRNILKEKFNVDFYTPFKDPALFRMHDSVLAWKKKSVSFCLEEHIIDGKIVDM